MNSNLKEVSLLNGPMLIKVEDDVISINAYQHETRIPFIPKDQPNAIEEVLEHRKGEITYEVTSDIYDCLNFNFKEKNLEKENMLDIFHHLLDASIHFIAKISKEENLPVLIQNSFDEKKMYFLSTIGLLDDTRIIFAEIKLATKKRKSKVKNDA